MTWVAAIQKLSVQSLKEPGISWWLEHDWLGIGATWHKPPELGSSSHKDGAHLEVVVEAPLNVSLKQQHNPTGPCCHPLPPSDDKRTTIQDRPGGPCCGGPYVVSTGASG
jgi:hypothetical protein